MIPKRWHVYQSDSEKAEALAKELVISPLVCQVLINRGIDTIDAIRRFLDPGLKQIHDPFLLKDMSKAVERITYALKKREGILIYGDYDVDGITASALLMEFLQGHGGAVQVRLPNRIKDGYGITKKAVEDALHSKVGLIITVDCGISDFEAIDHACKMGIDTIITDHHSPPKELPNATAIINPKQEGCPYPYKDLAGVGVALKLAQALTLHWQMGQMGINQVGNWPALLNQFLDLVCLGTIADVMPLTGENRVLVKFGLEALDKTQRPGLLALKDIAGIRDKKMTAGLVAFGLAPRINATGRIYGPEEGFNLLCTNSIKEATDLARFLNLQNQRRRQMEDKILTEAHKKIEREFRIEDEMIIVLSDQDWHPGVIGIVAQKLVEEYFRPALVISLKSGFGRGSARSIPQINLYKLLDQCKGYLKDFGGHAAAAGLTIEEERIPIFRKQANKILKDTIRMEDLVPEMYVDLEMDSRAIDYELIDQLNRLGPFGSQNPEPSLCMRGITLACPPQILKDAHIKMHIKQGQGTHEAIGFNMQSMWNRISIQPDQAMDIVFYPQVNTWQGHTQVQLRIKDIKAHASH